MNRIRFGKTELQVSELAFGGIPIMRLPREEAVSLVRYAMERGINFIDTAWGYGDSEEKIGAAVRGLPRDEIVLSSKSPASDKKTFTEHLDTCLKRVGTDHFDIYHLHNVSTREKMDAVFAPGGALEGLLDAVKAGKVRFPAFSAHNLRTAKLLMESGQFSVTQIPFNFVDDQGTEEALPLAKRLDLGLIAMKPLGGGLLSRADLCFKFLKGFDWIVPDPGVEKKEELDEIIDIYENGAVLSEEDRAEMGAIRAEMGDEWCHRCDYCQPCPKGIPISSVLIAKSAAKRMTKEAAAAFLEPSMRLAEECIECGQCASRCPYKLDIPALLKRNISSWKRFKETGIFG